VQPSWRGLVMLHDCNRALMPTRAPAHAASAPYCQACGSRSLTPSGVAMLERVRGNDVERANLPQPVPTERELHQLAARAAALDEITIIYRAVHAQRASYAPDSEAFRALSWVLELLRVRRGDSGGRPA
jgi:hypothetical protein